MIDMLVDRIFGTTTFTTVITDDELIQREVTPAMAASRVMSGAAFLDETVPGWERDIDLATLAIMHCRHCILGQLQHARCDEVWTGGGYDYADGFNLTTGEGKWGTVHEPGQPMQPSPNWRVLEETWISLIKTRFDTGALSDA